MLDGKRHVVSNALRDERLVDCANTLIRYFNSCIYGVCVCMNIRLDLNFIFPFSYSLTCVIIYLGEKENYKNKTCT